MISIVKYLKLLCIFMQCNDRHNTNSIRTVKPVDTMRRSSNEFNQQRDRTELEDGSKFVAFNRITFSLFFERNLSFSFTSRLYV